MYCVKQLSAAEIAAGTIWEKVRKNEDEFFASTAAWSDLDEMYKKYLCTSDLVERVEKRHQSTMITHLILYQTVHIIEWLTSDLCCDWLAVRHRHGPTRTYMKNKVNNRTLPGMVYGFVHMNIVTFLCTLESLFIAFFLHF